MILHLELWLILSDYYNLHFLECWKDIHPAFKTIPLISSESMPYGVIYSKKPSEDSLKFLDIIKSVLNTQN